MKEKENGFYERRNEIQLQESRLEALIEKQRQEHLVMQKQAQAEYMKRREEIELLEIQRNRFDKNHFAVYNKVGHWPKARQNFFLSTVANF